MRACRRCAIRPNLKRQRAPMQMTCCVRAFLHIRAATDLTWVSGSAGRVTAGGWWPSLYDSHRLGYFWRSPVTAQPCCGWIDRYCSNNCRFSGVCTSRQNSNATCLVSGTIWIWFWHMCSRTPPVAHCPFGQNSVGLAWVCHWPCAAYSLI